MYILLGSQSLTFISPSFVKMCHNFITFNLDDDAIKALKNKSGRPSSEVTKFIYENPLELYEFLYTSARSKGIQKMKLQLI